MGWADDGNAKIRKAVRLALNQIGRESVADIRQSINVKVQRISGEIIRSDPGEPPRREFSKLWRSIRYKVQPRARTIEDLTVYTRRLVALFLEYGTHNMEPRPFFAPARQRMGDVVPYFKSLVARYLREAGRGSGAESEP